MTYSTGKNYITSVDIAVIQSPFFSLEYLWNGAVHSDARNGVVKGINVAISLRNPHVASVSVTGTTASWILAIFSKKRKIFPLLLSTGISFWVIPGFWGFGYLEVRFFLILMTLRRGCLRKIWLNSATFCATYCRINTVCDFSIILGGIHHHNMYSICTKFHEKRMKMGELGVF